MEEKEKLNRLYGILQGRVGAGYMQRRLQPLEGKLLISLHLASFCKLCV